MIEYKIITAQGWPQSIENAVSKALADGWQLCGGVCATMHQGSGVVSYYQAMTRSTSPAAFVTTATPLVEAVATSFAAPVVEKPKRGRKAAA